MGILTLLFISFLFLCFWLGPKQQKAVCSFSHESPPGPGDLPPPLLGFRVQLASQEDPVAGTPQLCAKLPGCLWQALLLAKAWDVDTSSHSPGLACQQTAGDHK